MIYFDNAATTRPSPGAIAAFTGAAEAFGNPSSLHGLGIEAERVVTNAAKTIAARLNATPDEIVFTSGGTESNNTAIGCFAASKARGNGRRRVITTRADHPSVTAAVERLRLAFNADVVYAKLTKEGFIDLDDLAGLVTPETALVSFTRVNSETGVIQPAARIAALVKERNPNTLVHADAAQSFGKLDGDAEGADYVTLSAHKLHGLKGAGALFVRKGAPFAPLIHGGGQQGQRRGGTENVPAIAAFGAAVDETFELREETVNNVYQIHQFLVKSLLNIDGVVINGGGENGDGSGKSPFILNFSVVRKGRTDLKSEIMLHALEESGVYVSAGSACSSRRKTVRAIEAYGLPPERGESALRLSFSRYNTIEEAAAFVEAFRDMLARLR